MIANGPGDQSSIPDQVIPKTQKVVLYTSLINIQYYKVCTKDKEEQPRGTESSPPQHLGLVAIEKGTFGSPSTTVTNFTLCIYIYIYI